MSKDVIIACDFNSKADLMTFLDKFENEDRKPFLKVGNEQGTCAIRSCQAFQSCFHHCRCTCRMKVADIYIQSRENRHGFFYGIGDIMQLEIQENLMSSCLDFLYDGEIGDQVRVTTPAKARELGSDYIVVGRPITQAADPVQAYHRCIREFLGGEVE